MDTTSSPQAFILRSPAQAPGRTSFYFPRDLLILRTCLPVAALPQAPFCQLASAVSCPNATSKFPLTPEPPVSPHVESLMGCYLELPNGSPFPFGN